MVLSTIHVSQAHIFEKQSRCRESSSSVSTVVPVPGFFFSVYFRYRASEPEGHRVICMHVQDAEHAVIKSGDILILDDFERVFSTFTENVAIFDPEGSSTVEDVFNKCGSSIMVINDISLKPKEIEAFQHIQNIEEISGEHNAEVLSDKVQNDMQESLRLIRAAAAAESTSSVECSLLCFEREHSCFDVDGNEIIREVRWIVSSASENAPDSESDQEINSEQAPEPLEDSARCMRCSHVGICLPEERKLCAVAHRVMVSSPDNQVTHLATPGAKAFTRSGRMIVQKNGEELASIPIDTMQGLQIYGNTDLSSGLIRELMWRDIPIVWCSGTGRMYGWSIPSYGPNGEQRVDQHVASHEGRLGLAREFIVAKIHNQSVLLRRSESDNPVLPQLRHIEKQVGNANRWQDILGLEGESAALYFSQFEHLIKTDRQAEWPWIARMRRPAPDALNALLDFTYTLLLSDCVRALISCGLDPHAGFLHSSKRNKPALALDLMEEFRAPIADSVVQTVINNGEINASGFSDALGSVRMTDETRKTVIKAYERRMATEIIHPVFKYKASWRRTIEIQARMILGYLDGTQTEYRGIRIR